MSLNIYKRVEEIPDGIEYVKNNELFFVGEIIGDDEVSRRILREVEQGEYVNKNYFLGRVREDGNLNKENLSTGTKTLLNIINHRNICFDVLECGDNALYALRLIHNGNVLDMNGVFLLSGDDTDCDIIYNGKMYTDLRDYVECRKEEFSNGS